MERQIAPAAVSAIVARLPHVQRIEASLFDNKKTIRLSDRVCEIVRKLAIFELSTLLTGT